MGNYSSVHLKIYY